MGAASSPRMEAEAKPGVVGLPRCEVTKVHVAEVKAVSRKHPLSEGEISEAPEGHPALPIGKIDQVQRPQGSRVVTEGPREKGKGHFPLFWGHQPMGVRVKEAGRVWTFSAGTRAPLCPSWVFSTWSSEMVPSAPKFDICNRDIKFLLNIFITVTVGKNVCNRKKKKDDMLTIVTNIILFACSSWICCQWAAACRLLLSGPPIGEWGVFTPPL